MNKYEAVIILKNDFTDENKKEILDKCKKLMKKWEINEVGFKRLAYTIKGYNRGYYIYINFEQKKENIAEIQRYFGINETIIKFILVRRDD